VAPKFAEVERVSGAVRGQCSGERSQVPVEFVADGADQETFHVSFVQSDQSEPAGVFGPP
jgi:hypothetical protein